MVFLLASSHGEPVVAVQTAMDQARQQLAHATGPVAQSACGTLMEQCMQRRKGFVLCAEGKFVTMQVSVTMVMHGLRAEHDVLFSAGVHRAVQNMFHRLVLVVSSYIFGHGSALSFAH